MKKIQYITISLFTLLCLYSCTTSDEGYSRKTEAAKLVYDETRYTLAEYLAVVDLAQKIDKYLHAEGVERDEIKYNTLEGYDILETENNLVILVKNKYLNLVWTITRVSTNPITTPSAQWSIKSSANETTQDNALFRITAQSTPNTWRMEAIDCRKEYQKTLSNADIKIEMVTKDESSDINYDYSVNMMGDTSGSINSTLSELFDTTYQITTPMLFVLYDDNYDYYHGYNSGRFIEGEIKMEVERASSDKIDDITAEISNGGNNISIVFRGIRETWYLY